MTPTMTDPAPHHTPTDASSPPLLKVRGLQKSYWLGRRRIDVLKGVDLAVAGGDRIAVVGPSGSGKSTLLHVLGTLDEPTDGQVLYDGKDIFRLSEDGLAGFRNANIGFVFQFHYLLPEFTALENAMMPALIRRLDKKEARARGEEVLNWVGLGERLQHKPGELSGGEQQRVALARALTLKPRLLLADEPTGNLDGDTAGGIHRLLADLNQKWGVALVVVTHNLTLAESLDRVLSLRHGLLHAGHSEETSETPGDE